MKQRAHSSSYPKSHSFSDSSTHSHQTHEHHSASLSRHSDHSPHAKNGSKEGRLTEKERKRSLLGLVKSWPVFDFDGENGWKESFRRVSTAELLQSHQIPPYYRTPFIQNGYRPSFSSIESICSFFRWHNETLNMWTHGLGALLFIALAYRAMFSIPFEFSASRWLLAIQASCCGLTLFTSTTYHTIGCMSEEWYAWGMRLDVVGILVSVWGQQAPLIWHIWGCYPMYRIIHTTCMTFLGVAGVIFSFHPKFYTFEFRKWRSLILVVASMYWIVCLVHYSRVTGDDMDATILFEIVSGSSIAFLVGGGILLAGGGILLARVPERILKPGALDLSWWSHPIWHLFVISGFFAIHTLIFSVLHFIESHPHAICLLPSVS
eukprot:TRINITY_DN1349_c0_g2_i1.p1 TRINITY_DN1349_c0_g2~~TRINITY_DN1349_c0_g2_i1.p1  ORF type:complete len:377 (-),score=51.38 TRINITY_DN1349_c0_g2_i1:44-1174(-)